MNSTNSGIFILLTLLLVFQLHFLNVNAIRCFQCNSYNNSGCTNLENYKKDLFRPLQCEDFDGRQAFCRKTVIKVLEKNKDYDERVIRSCGYIPYKNPCYTADNEGHAEKVCQCFEDGCNSAQSVALPIVLLLTSYIILKIANI